jgi:uncharacterized small protein (DUF1192 family)
MGDYDENDRPDPGDHIFDLTVERDRLAHDNKRLRAEVERLKVEVVHAHECWEAASACWEAAEAEVERLREWKRAFELQTAGFADLHEENASLRAEVERLKVERDEEKRHYRGCDIRLSEVRASLKLTMKDNERLKKDVADLGAQLMSCQECLVEEKALQVRYSGEVQAMRPVVEAAVTDEQLRTVIHDMENHWINDALSEETAKGRLAVCGLLEAYLDARGEDDDG